MGRKKLKFMDVNEEDVLDREEMRNIMAGSGGGSGGGGNCTCPGGPCTGSGPLCQQCCDAIYLTCYYPMCSDYNCLVEGATVLQCTDEVNRLYEQCVRDCTPGI